MKTLFCLEDVDLETDNGIEYFTKYLQPDGFVIHEEYNLVTKLIDKEWDLAVGDSVYLYGRRTITDKVYDIDNDLIEYNLTE